MVCIQTGFSKGQRETRKVGEGGSSINNEKGPVNGN